MRERCSRGIASGVGPSLQWDCEMVGDTAHDILRRLGG